MFSTQNATKFSTVQTPCLSSDSPLPTASCKPHIPVPRTLHTTSRTDRQIRSPQHAVYCTSQTLLMNHEYGLPSNCVRNRTYWMWSKSSSSYGSETCRTDGQPDWLDCPTVFDSCIFCEQHNNHMWFQVSSSVKWDLLSSGMLRSIDWCSVGDVSGQPINSIFKRWDQQVVPKRR